MKLRGLAEMINKEQTDAIIVLYKCGQYYYKEIAEKTGVSVSTVNKVIKKYEEDRKKGVSYVREN